MNRSNLAPSCGRRKKMIKKATNITAAILVMILSGAFLFVGVFENRLTSDSDIPIDTLPCKTDTEQQDIDVPDELECDFADILDDPEYFSENDALALSVYDEIFGTDGKVKIPKGELKIKATDLSKSPTGDKIYLKNNTPIKVNVADFLTINKKSVTVSTGSKKNISDKPLVLIYHTHGTEGYAEEGKVSYLKKDLPRSSDVTKNVVAVGEVLADTLNGAGIPTLHCETMFDSGGNYNHAYECSCAGVEKILKENPSIRYIFDLHRDALIGDGVAYKVLTYDESEPVAQVMLVVGSNAAGADHPKWKENLAFAVDLQYMLTRRSSNLMRPICLKNSSLSQEFSNRSLLIEIGTCVNTLSEAKSAAAIFGQTLASVITSEYHA